MTGSTTDFRWGIAATGRIAARVGAVIAAEPGMRVVAVGSRDVDRARAFAETVGAEHAYGSYAELVQDPDVDAVYIATPHAQHAEIARLAFAAGKPVLCEKPLAVTSEGASRLVEQAREAQVFCMEAMWMRFNPLIRRIQGMVGDGDEQIGEIRTLNASFGFPMPFDATHRLWAPELGGGALLDLGIYPVALAYLLLGEPQTMHVAGSLAANGVDAEAALMLVWDGGVRAFLETSLVSPLAVTATVTGTRGRIEIDAPFHAATRMRLHVGGEAQEFTIATPEEAFAEELREVRDCVQAGRLESDVMPLDATLGVMRLLDDARRALGAVEFAQDS